MLKKIDSLFQNFGKQNFLLFEDQDNYQGYLIDENTLSKHIRIFANQQKDPSLSQIQNFEDLELVFVAACKS